MKDLSAAIPSIPVTLRLEGSEMLIEAMDNHIRTCELVKALACEKAELLASLARLRLQYAQLQGALLEHMRT